MEQKMLNVGFGNLVVASRIVAIVSPASTPSKRLKTEAKEDKRLIDATQGRKTRAIVILDSNHVVLSAIHNETIAQRMLVSKEQDRVEDDE
ncbi:MAG: DUF370 domain-containing protein [Desulfatirhabdiaceae bacterium]